MLDAIDAMLMTDTLQSCVRAFSSMAGMKARVMRNMLFTFRSKLRSQSASEHSIGHHARAVEQGIQRGGALRQRLHGFAVAHVQPHRLDARLLGGQPIQQWLVDVGGDHPRTLGGTGQGAGAANALCRRGDEDGFACQTTFTHTGNLG
jgi:hypothetical protein